MLQSVSMDVATKSKLVLGTAKRGNNKSDRSVGCFQAEASVDSARNE